MSTTTLDPPTKRREAAARGVLIVLAASAIYLLGLVIWPFWKALFLAAVLAGALYPGFARLAERLGGRRQLASAMVTFAVVLVLVVPAFLLTLTMAREVVNGAQYVRETLRSEGVAGLVRDLPPRVRGMAQAVLDEIPKDEEDQISGMQGTKAAAAVGTVLSATSSALMQAGMMLIAFFFLLTDGPRLVDWLCGNAPLPASHTRGLLLEFRKVSVSVLVSSAATAAVQAFVAFVGYLIAHVPHPLFFAAVTFLFAFVPAVGGGGTCVALAGLVFVTGHPGAALFLLMGTVAVGLSDNALKPLLMQSDVQLHGALIFFALVGGLTYFGAIGLVAGPLILVFFIAVVKMSRQEYKPATAES
jgi:predicted PurR-regulated permease PerM